MNRDLFNKAIQIQRNINKNSEFIEICEDMLESMDALRDYEELKVPFPYSEDRIINVNVGIFRGFLKQEIDKYEQEIKKLNAEIEAL